MDTVDLFSRSQNFKKSAQSKFKATQLEMHAPEESVNKYSSNEI